MIDEGGEEEVAFLFGIADIDGNSLSFGERIDEVISVSGVSCGDDE